MTGRISPAAGLYSALRRFLYTMGRISNSSKSSLLLHIPSGPGPVHSLSFLRPLVAHVIGHSLDRRRANLLGKAAPMHTPGCQDHLRPANAATGRDVSSGI